MIKTLSFPLASVLLVLVACSSSTITRPSITETSLATPTAELAPPPTAIIAPTLDANPTATPNTHLPPEQWQEWPVVPQATGRAIDIYRAGLAMGNNPRAFSKIGDCQNIKAAFMGFFDIPDRYYLGTDYQYLQETIDNFSGYFNTDGQAVKGGFNAATVLSPMWANPAICQPGENSLECELRVTKPSIVFISFEVWWEGRTTETYEKYMRQVIETVIAHGAVPILATKADNVEGDQSLNLATARMAYEYDLPLWNFWLAVQSLPNHGMDTIRNDGFHISTDGWNKRSFTGLQALDSVWHGVRDAVSITSGISTTTPVPTPKNDLSPLPTGVQTLASGNNKIVFSLASRQGGIYKSLGVYYFDLSTQVVTQLFQAGFTFQSASPDGKNLLISRANSLYRTDGSTLLLLTDHFFDSGSIGAFWLRGGRIVAILEEGLTTQLALFLADGTGWSPIHLDVAPVWIYPSSNGDQITWEGGTCVSTNHCTSSGAWLTDLSTAQSTNLIGMSHPIIAPNIQLIAYASSLEQNRSNLAFGYLDGRNPRQYPLPGDVLADMSWQPNGPWLAVNLDIRSDYSGKVTGGKFYLVNSQDFSVRQLQPVSVLLNQTIIWSPDGTRLIWLGTTWKDASYSVDIWEINVVSGKEVDLSDELGLMDTDYLFVQGAAWLGQP
jgi:hypothetical protein